MNSKINNVKNSIDPSKIVRINGIIKDVSLKVIPHFNNEIFLNLVIETEKGYYRVLNDCALTTRIGEILKSIFEVATKKSHVNEDGEDLVKILKGCAVKVLTINDEIVGIENIISQDFYLF